ncbi:MULTISPECIES: hypothetical protein [unclassified Massilia]|jgi:hypothetical protein|uniref:hypothetical protein n=1 Tax=unclassified Massilia TaxID=2609279 RepID=UPI001B822F8C|nr:MULTISPECIES: hypothetical protein [unclassified Massilia]MBQ5939531.1 hypothetical protein [Massilia sp. AB1]MBQ5962006.1 hypothetical protein [Massilia sp. ZL223]
MILEPRESDASFDQQRVDAVVAQGPRGAFAVAGLAVAIVMAMWVAFYVLVYLARGGD